MCSTTQNRIALLTISLTVALAPADWLQGQVCYINESDKVLASATDQPDTGNPVVIDGSIAMVGMRRHNQTPSGGTGIDSVAVLEAGKSWMHVQTLSAQDAAGGDGFGFAIGLNGDRAIIGAPGDDFTMPQVINAGSAYIFTRDEAGVWSQAAKLVASDPTMADIFGQAVAIHGDVALVGASGAGAANSGAVYVFRFDGAAWNQTQILIGSDSLPNDGFGTSVAFDGTNAVVGAIGVGPDSGAAYVFEDDGQQFTERQILTSASPPNGERFGWSVAIDGDNLAVGMDSTVVPGKVHAFAFDGKQWALASVLTIPDPSGGVNPNPRFGYAVAIRGSSLLTSAPYAPNFYPLIPFSPAASMAGAGYLYTLVGGKWVFEHKLQKDWIETPNLPLSNTDFAGQSVALNDDMAVLGSPFVIGDSSPQIGAYFYSLQPPDCDGNGVPDRCDPDCNNNRIPDACDIADGRSGDCDGDTVPDECQNGHDYQLDVGTTGIIYGFNGQFTPNGGDFIWLNQFNVQSGGQYITHITTPWTSYTPDGTAVTVLVYDDPNNDGDPHDAVLVAQGSGETTDDFGLSFSPFGTAYAIGPVHVGDVGDSFFIGAHMQVEPDVYVAVTDMAPSLGRSWLAINPIGTGDIQTLSNNATLNPFPPNGNWRLRAIALDCNGNGAWDQCDIDSGSSLDSNKDGIPDECQPLCAVADATGNGVVDVDDLLTVINGWGACEPPPGECAGDLTGDGVVDVDDLLTVVNNWGPCV